MVAHAPWAALRAVGTLPKVAACVIDTRPRAQCLRETVATARCLPPAAFLGPRGQLANFRDIRWLLGTAGLGGAKTAVVVGDERTARDFVAGILYLAGQRRVVVVRRPLTPWLAAHPAAAGPGEGHGMIRTRIYAAWPRTHLVVFRAPLARLLAAPNPPQLLDGCPAGWSVRHPQATPIPGSRAWPFARLGGQWRPPAGRRPFIAYAQDPYHSVAYFTALRLRHLPAEVFIGGLRAWHAARAPRALPAPRLARRPGGY